MTDSELFDLTPNKGKMMPDNDITQRATLIGAVRDAIQAARDAAGHTDMSLNLRKVHGAFEQLVASAGGLVDDGIAMRPPEGYAPYPTPDRVRLALEGLNRAPVAAQNGWIVGEEHVAGIADFLRLTYGDTARSLAAAGATTIPGLLRHLISAAVRQNVFRPGGLAEFAHRVEQLAAVEHARPTQAEQDDSAWKRASLPAIPPQET